MEAYNLKVDSPIVGGYFSSEQIDILSIIQCETLNDLFKFIADCDQINRLDGIYESISGKDLETAKREIVKKYQSTMVAHDASNEESVKKRLEYLGVPSEDIVSIVGKNYPLSEEVLSLNHHFISEERDQMLDENLYEEMSLLNSQLPYFNSMLIGSGRIYSVVNRFDTDKETKCDFYHAKRDLAFAYKNGKQVRYHSLLVKEDGRLFEGKTKEQILEQIRFFVKNSVDFVNSSIDSVNEYASKHGNDSYSEDKPIINAIDLFNEIISFDKNAQGEYYNIWEEKYGITLEELVPCFDYALENKHSGVSYLYNEPFLEDDERRKKVIDTLKQIQAIRPGLIDTLGSQMHITLNPDLESIKRCFSDFKELQDSGINIQITEFDMSLGKNQISKVFGPNAVVTLEQIYQLKKDNIAAISYIIDASGVRPVGISYWSLTDGIDCNLERLRTEAKNNEIPGVQQIPTACGGLFPTHKKLINVNIMNQANQMNQVNQMNQMNQMNQVGQMNQSPQGVKMK